MPYCSYNARKSLTPTPTPARSSEKDISCPLFFTFICRLVTPNHLSHDRCRLYTTLEPKDRAFFLQALNCRLICRLLNLDLRRRRTLTTVSRFLGVDRPRRVHPSPRCAVGCSSLRDGVEVHGRWLFCCLARRLHGFVE